MMDPPDPKRRKLTSSQRKRATKEKGKQRIYIGQQHARFQEISNNAGLGSVGMMKVLLDTYISASGNADTNISVPRVTDLSVAVQSTPAKGHETMPPPFLSGSDIQSASSDSATMTGIEKMSSSEAEPESRQIIAYGQRRQSLPPARKQSFIYSFEDSDGVDEFFDVDDDLDNAPRNISLVQEDEGEVSSDDDSVDADGDVTFDLGEDSEDDVDIHDMRGDGIIIAENADDVTSPPTTIAFQQCIVDLANTKIEKCNACGRKAEISVKKTGTAMYLTWACTAGHVIHKWGSQPIVQNVQGGDLLVSSAIMLSGNNFAKIKLMFKFLNLGIVNETTHYRFQRLYTIPVVEAYWDDMNDRVIESLQGRSVIVAGDGRNDSPGHSAKYCVYTVLDSETQDIINCVVVDKRQTQLKSTNMEKKALETALDDLLRKGVNVVEVVTDQHLQIGSLLKTKYPTIKHSFDIWHVAKNLNKKLNQAGLQSGNEDLLRWNAKVVTHFWHCAEVALGEELRFVDKWTSIMNHVTGVHTSCLPDFDGNFGCDHEDLGPESTQPMSCSSPAFAALEKIVFDTRFLNNADHYANFRHTGIIETINNHQLMYAAKRFAYKYPAFKARCLLACIDYMKHKNRQNLLKPTGEKQYRRKWNKRSNTWTVNAKKEAKGYVYMTELLNDIIDKRLNDREPLNRKAVLQPDDPRRIASTIARTQPEPTQVLVERQTSRFPTS